MAELTQGSANVGTVNSVAKAGKYLTFQLAAEEYGIEILKVREIIGLMRVTRIPQSPHYIRGVINLRGKVIPVVDLRTRFGMESTEDTEQSCIIVVDVTNADGSLMMGVVVDAVSEVLDIQQSDIEPAPQMSEMDTDVILGMGRIKNDVKILLDIDKVLSSGELLVTRELASLPTNAHSENAPETSNQAMELETVER